MEVSNLTHFTLDDVVFQGRNRAYGAYILRKNYDSNLRKALAIAVLLMVCLIALPLLYQYVFPADPVIPKKGSPTIIDGYELTEVILPPVTSDPAAAGPAAAPAEPVTPATTTPATTIPTVVQPNDHVIDKPLPPETTGTTHTTGASSLPGSNSGATDGTGVSGGVAGGATDGTGAGTGNAKIYEGHAETMPQFGSGIADLMKYLGEHINYPAEARSAKVQGMVVVSFVVMPDGSISDVKVLKDLGYGTGAEAMRVVKNMPRWQPGRQHSHAVPVRMTLPVRFTIK